MNIAIFFAAVIGGLVLDRQEKRHRYEKRLQYDRLGWKIPLQKPRISMLESWANIILGAILFAAGVLFLKTLLEIPRELAVGILETPVAITLASGFALMWLGVKAVRQNVLYNSRREPPPNDGLRR